MDFYRKGHPWQQFHHDITADALYSESAPYMTDLLHDLATLKITNASQFRGGTQLKFDITLEDGNRVIAKPMRYTALIRLGNRRSISQTMGWEEPMIEFGGLLILLL